MQLRDYLGRWRQHQRTKDILETLTGTCLRERIFCHTSSYPPMTGRRYNLWYYLGGTWIVDDSFLGWTDLKVDHVTNGNLSEIVGKTGRVGNLRRRISSHLGPGKEEVGLRACQRLKRCSGFLVCPSFLPQKPEKLLEPEEAILSSIPAPYSYIHLACRMHRENVYDVLRNYLQSQCILQSDHD